MRKRLGKSLGLALSVTLMLSVSAQAAMVTMDLVYNGQHHAYAAEEVHIQIDGKEFTDSDMPAVIINSRTMLPVGAIARELGAEVEWNDSTKQAVIVKDGTVVLFQINSNKMVVDSVARTLDVPPMIINDRTMVPVAALAEGLDLNVNWVESTRTVEITEKDDSSQIGVPIDPTYPGTTTPNTPSTAGNGRINKVSLPEDKRQDQIFTIQADAQITNYQEVELSDTKIVLDIYGFTSGLASTVDTTSNSAVVTAVRSAYHSDGNYTRVVFDLKEACDYQITCSGSQIQVYFPDGKVTVPEEVEDLDGLRYVVADQVLYLEEADGFRPSDIEHEDYYREGYYELILPGNYSDYYETGEMYIGDDVMESIQVYQSGGNTVIRFNQNATFAYTVEEDGDGYAVYVQDPKEVYDAVVVLDAGHGGSDPGSIANGLTEAELNLDIILKVADLLEERDDIKLYLTREDTTYMQNADRAELANECADLFLSVHMNSAESLIANGTETLYYTHSSDPSDLTSKDMAQIVQNYLITYLGATNRGIKERSDLIVLNSTKVPAVLVETGFISNPGEALKLSSESYRQTVANALAAAIEDIIDNYDYRD